MVIGRDFAWGHLQKTAGDATWEMFRLFGEIVEFADPRNEEIKHASFAERERQVRGKLLASNVRRLPSWTLSWAQHRARYAHRPDGRRVQMNSPHQMVKVPRADMRLNAMTGDGRFPVERWLRMENLAEDFIAFVSDFTEVTADDRRHVAEFAPVNALTYDHEAGHWFTPAQVRRLYENNPAWAAVEERVYGDLLLLD